MTAGSGISISQFGGLRPKVSWGLGFPVSGLSKFRVLVS